MKKIILPFLFLLLNVTLEAQQSLQLDWDMIYSTTDEARKSLGLSWYREDASRSGYVLRLAYLNAEETDDFNYYKVRNDMLQFDVVKRWHSPRGKGVSAYTEGGISGMIMNKDFEPSYPYLFYCDCLVNPSSIVPVEAAYDPGADLVYNIDEKEYWLYLLPGLSAGGGLEFFLTKHLYFGLQTRVNFYYWLDAGKWLFYMNYGLSTGYRF